MERHLAWFEEFVNGFLTGEPEHDQHIRLKREHSLNVLAEARAILARERPGPDTGVGLAPCLERAALLAALYHDMGRFPQYRTYATFRDDISENHAHLGVRTLRPLALIRALDAPLRALVLGAVVLHNRRSLPGRISPELRFAANVVRDSDKLDIVRIMLEHMRPGGKRSEVVMLHVADEPERYTPRIVRQIEARSIGDYALMRYGNDFALLLLSWVYDLNFACSRRAFLERGHAEEIFGLLPKVPELTRLKDRIYDDLKR